MRIETDSFAYKMILIPLVFLFFNWSPLLVFVYYKLDLIESVPLIILNIIVFYDMLTRKRSKEKDNFNRVVLIISFLVFPFAICGPYLERALFGNREISYVLFILGIILEILGGCLVIRSRKTLGEMGTTSIVIEKNHALVDKGLYRHIRNPMYSGFFCLIVGYSLSVSGFISCILVDPVILWILVKRTKIEEKILEERFGNDYLEYKKRTKRFIPWIY